MPDERITSAGSKNGRQHTRELHRSRLTPSIFPDIQSDPDLAEAYRELQLHWLREYPAYKELIRHRVSEAAKKAERKSLYVDRSHAEVDYLGREIEGCG